MTRSALPLLALLLGGCVAPPPEATMLDKEYEAYRGDREERRYEDLKARYAKSKAESDRLETELRRLEKEIAAKKIRVSEATAAALRLPDPVRVTAVPAAPSSSAASSPPAGGAGK